MGTSQSPAERTDGSSWDTLQRRPGDQKGDGRCSAWNRWCGKWETPAIFLESTHILHFKELAPLHSCLYPLMATPRDQEMSCHGGFSGTHSTPTGEAPTHPGGRAGSMCHTDVLRKQPSTWPGADCRCGTKTPTILGTLQTFLLWIPVSFGASCLL